ncbi:ABC transporter substrate-binding protein [Desertifilum sp. FACHB-1129]|uniref:ABC transporter substrate-binding protein n=1 Tax=Desertifilum tharense IPPAS B-1220 TaxID=1781255 RepID=A0A1E5QPA2_9CYAN|nr:MULTISPECIES: ABC transporter substrate-binding protein [Desertifilum]MDA0211067.1 ABC transporter substrate-binding protein [Cyanobacteria bacterium FC1]MBD2312681.1 ABC transporter substrate-binding protein [Desertifilum sp. FACHB-1129]MBD2320162.1 ABC transporter substrate-binding protein [Desertifilum sp. FACHB-866]MBD2330290.1 ABC transporter substrate-binding protein [Desertifilum sp. FACHB-868]OEJ76478.1 ABC transporter substrate-binding protein [Desertifilum tharense IPPAS B-1220]
MNSIPWLSQVQAHLLRRKFWRLFGITLAFLFGLHALVALPGNTQQPVTLSLMMNSTEVPAWRDVLIPAFEEAHPNIRINLIEGPNQTNLQEDLYTSAFLLGDSPYDLIMMDVIWTPKFAAAGWLLPLDDRVNAAQLNQDFLEQDVQGGRYEDRLYRIPFRSDVGMLYYRTDLLEQVGAQPPETFTELVEISQQIQQNTDVNWGYVWQGRQYEGLSAMFVEILQGFGGFWVNPETNEVGLDRPEALEAVNFLRSTIQQGISPSGVTTYAEEETRRFFQSGQAAFLRNWPYVWPLANEDSPVAGRIGIRPMVAQPDSTSGACLGGWGFGIAVNSAHPDEAWTAIEYFTSEEAQRRFILETGYVPSRRSLFTDPEITARYAHYPQLLEVVESAVLRPPIPQYAQASDILQRYLNGALTGRFTPERALQSAANETRRLLNVGGDA